eukprot:COSAG04_NODE_3917_length_2424_cov_139.574194_3_plen_173_part_00
MGQTQPPHHLGPWGRECTEGAQVDGVRRVGGCRSARQAEQHGGHGSAAEHVLPALSPRQQRWLSRMLAAMNFCQFPNLLCSRWQCMIHCMSRDIWQTNKQTWKFHSHDFLKPWFLSRPFLTHPFKAPPPLTPRPTYPQASASPSPGPPSSDPERAAVPQPPLPPLCAGGTAQ